MENSQTMIDIGDEHSGILLTIPQAHEVVNGTLVIDDLSEKDIISIKKALAEEVQETWLPMTAANDESETK